MATATLETDSQMVAFKLDSETYGIPISLINEIIRPTDITQVPRTAAYVHGVINLRGKIVPVIDLRTRLGLPPVEESRNTRIIVVETDAGVIGMTVDAVSEVIRLESDQIEPPSQLVADVDTEFVRGVGKLGSDLVILLDVQKTLQVETSVVSGHAE